MNVTAFIIPAIISIGGAVLAAYMADGRGRRPMLWAVLGFFFPLVSLIVLAVLGRPSEASAAQAA